MLHRIATAVKDVSSILVLHSSGKTGLKSIANLSLGHNIHPFAGGGPKWYNIQILVRRIVHGCTNGQSQDVLMLIPAGCAVKQPGES